MHLFIGLAGSKDRPIAIYVYQNGDRVSRRLGDDSIDFADAARSIHLFILLFSPPLFLSLSLAAIDD